MRPNENSKRKCKFSINTWLTGRLRWRCDDQFEVSFWPRCDTWYLPPREGRLITRLELLMTAAGQAWKAWSAGRAASVPRLGPPGWGASRPESRSPQHPTPSGFCFFFSAKATGQTSGIKMCVIKEHSSFWGRGVRFLGHCHLED